MITPGSGQFGPGGDKMFAGTMTEDDLNVVRKAKGVDIATATVSKSGKVKFKDEVDFMSVWGYDTDQDAEALTERTSFLDIEEGRQLKKGDKYYKELSWSRYNLITNRQSPEKKFRRLLSNPKPPLDTDEKLIAYSFEVRPLKRILSRVEYPVCEILDKVNDETKLMWYSLELDGGRFRMGAYVFLKEDGTYHIRRFYPGWDRNQ